MSSIIKQEAKQEETVHCSLFVPNEELLWDDRLNKDP